MNKRVFIIIHSSMLLSGVYAVTFQGGIIKMNVPLTGVLVLNEAKFGGIKIPQGAEKIAFNLDSTNHLSPGVVATVGIEISLDDGVTWEEIASSTRPGGIAFGDHGIQVTSFEMNTKLKEPENPNRSVRIFLRIDGGSLSTAGGSLTIE